MAGMVVLGMAGGSAADRSQARSRGQEGERRSVEAESARKHRPLTEKVDGDTVHRDTVPPERVGEEIPGYRATLRYLRSLRPIAPESLEAEPAGSAELLLDGLVVDETRTPVGRTFYDAFYRAWDPPEGVHGFTIEIREQPLPGVGSRVAVYMDDRRLFQLGLPGRRREIERLAERASAYVRQLLIRRRATESGEGARGTSGSDTSGLGD